MTGQLNSSPASSEDTPQTGSLVTVINSLSHTIEKELSSGDVASLRRLSPHDASSPAFWKVVVRILEPAGQLRQGEESERRWAAILQGLTTLGVFHRHGQGLGKALAEAAFTELRFVRLLQAHDERLFDMVRTTAKFLAAKGQLADWTDMAWLVLSDGRSDEEKVRRRLARDYYRHLS